MMVVAHHYGDFIVLPPVLRQIAANGQAGVGIFFVLSGFVLTYNYFDWFCNGPSGYFRFIRARFARIVPLHIVTLVLATPVTLYLVRRLHLESAIPGDVLLASWLSNLFLAHAYLPFQAFHVWDTPSWSISTEFSFYVVFPFFVWLFLSRTRRSRDLLYLAAGVLTASLISFLGVGIISWLGTARGPSAAILPIPKAWTFFLGWGDTADRLPFTRVWEFFLGCILGKIFLQNHPTPGSSIAATFLASVQMRNRVLMYSLVAVFALMMSPWNNLPGAYVRFAPIWALVIAALVAGPTFLTRILEHRWVVKLGEASYSLYLVHYIPVNLATFLAHVGPSYFVGNQVMEDIAWIARSQGYLFSAVLLVATLAASLALYTYVEVPARRRLRGHSSSDQEVNPRRGIQILPGPRQVQGMRGE